MSESDEHNHLLNNDVMCYFTIIKFWCFCRHWHLETWE